MFSNTILGWLHVVGAAVALLLGASQVFRAKGGKLHRQIGYAYVCFLLTADAAAFGVYQFTGRFTAFHAGALASAVCVIAGIVPFYLSPRPDRWRVHHAMWICWSYIGLWAAGLTELVVRTIHWSSRSQVVGATVLVTAIVTTVGFVLMRRLRNELVRLEVASAANLPFDSNPFGADRLGR